MHQVIAKHVLKNLFCYFHTYSSEELDIRIKKKHSTTVYFSSRCYVKQGDQLHAGQFLNKTNSLHEKF